MSELNDLLEAMHGILSEQKALQGYAVDFVDAHNQGDLQTMLKAFRGALTLYTLFLKEHEASPGMQEVVRDITRLIDRLGHVKEERVRNKNKRRR